MPQRALAVVIEIDDVPPPAVIHRVPRKTEILEPTTVETGKERHRFAGGKRARESTFNARWRNGGGRVVAAPDAVDQRFRPRVRIRLAHDHIAAIRIDFPALVARHDTRRNAGRPQ